MQSSEIDQTLRQFLESKGALSKALDSNLVTQELLDTTIGDYGQVKADEVAQQALN